MSDSFQTHGAFSWCELHTVDVGRARRFYADVIGWSLEEMDMPGGKYSVIKAGGRPVGGITLKKGADNGSASWVTYITVDDVDQRAAKATQAGGKVLSPPTDAPGVGRMATIEDPAGALICLIAYEPQGDR